ncbi:thioredoxin domain-containing protein [Colwellia sp. E2M01]|uniref:DsbA family protein n=1 Tax=Colwellia sp. E2M01 TaxID=2841561 RepID=UPI001C0948E3|nr:thioredoxin domain-containing protein [Colwellia sp. E2M01]MBU2869351.1 DsbA family protein [Colwellia sp. E2M01]
MRLLPLITIATSMLLTLLVSSCGTEKDNVEQDTASMTEAQKIEVLKSHIEHLTKQISVLNRNQQAIADKLGITKASSPSSSTNPNQQPTIDISTSASVGDANAKVVMVEFTDLHCPFCKRFHDERLPELTKAYIETGKLRFVGKNYPIQQLHPNAAVAAFSLECAREEGAYKEAKAWLFARGKNFTKNNITEFTTAMKLDNDKFNQCVGSAKTAEQINNDMKIARLIGIKSTPSFVIGLEKDGKLVDWKIITGSQPMENFAKAIDEYTELAETES